MTTDLWMLVAAAGLQWALILAAALPRMAENGLTWAFGPRDTPSLDVAYWAKRAQRASDNLQENLALFAILVLVVHVTGQADATTALGAQLFVGARLAHAPLYVAGVFLARTLAWCVSIVGLGLIAMALF